jgi:choline dehydrogenase-like flavoprotein
MTTRANLRVETNAQATRLLFEGKRGVGVEYRQGKEIMIGEKAANMIKAEMRIG